MASEDQSLPAPRTDAATGAARALFTPGLALAALIGATTWAFALWVGPWIAPVPRAPLVEAPADHDSTLDPTRHFRRDAGPGIAETGPVIVPEELTSPAPQPVLRRVSVRPGDTLMEVLMRAKIARDEAHAAITALRKVFNPRSLIAGTEIELTFDPPPADGTADTGPFQRMEFTESVQRSVGIARGGDGRFEAFVAKAKLNHVQTRAAGTIENSLYVDAARAGVPAPVIIELIRAMSFDVDFQRDVQPGDRFDVLYEQMENTEGRVVGAGDVLFASLTLSGKALPIYRFRMDDGAWDYFNPDGKSTRKALMRTPVDGARLSSRFGRRRHPILGYTKMHRGIDFAAPSGTPIMAAGRGVVAEARWNGGYGRYIRIRHNTAYSTAYAHLKSFARGIRRGVRVQQGQIIGYIGSTGRSTGPHLHYEVHRNNRQVNPLSVKLPTGKTLNGSELKRFLLARDEIDAARARLLPVAEGGRKAAARQARSRDGKKTEEMGVGGP